MDSRGLPNRPWYRNLVMASGYSLGYGAMTFPGLMQAILDEDSATFSSQVKALASAVERGSESFRDGRPPATDPQVDPPGEDKTNPAVIVALCVGIPFFLVGTILLVQKLSKMSKTDGKLGPTTYGTRSPVSTVTDDGTSTEV